LSFLTSVKKFPTARRSGGVETLLLEVFLNVLVVVPVLLGKKGFEKGKTRVQEDMFIINVRELETKSVENQELAKSG
jgi:hypothetical protein